MTQPKNKAAKMPLAVVKVTPVPPPHIDHDRWVWTVVYGSGSGEHYIGYAWWRWWAVHRANKRVRQIRRAAKRTETTRTVMADA